ncbi:MAG: energy transducer TonB [Ferruginibacter sp.]
MNSELILKSDLLDILFEKRNKYYGAYTLRKFYNNRLLKSIAIMLLAVALLSAFTFLPGPSAPASISFKDAEWVNLAPVAKFPEVKQPVKRQVAPKQMSTGKWLSRIIMVNKTEAADVLQNIDQLAIGSETSIILNGNGPEIIAPAIEGTNSGSTELSAAAVIDKITPMETADIMPEYPGGIAALRKFLVRNLTNPRDLEAGELISVKVKFVVGYDGKLKGFELLQDGGQEFNEEVLRVLKKMPAWIPGKSKGQNVSVYYAIPVKFVPED